MDIEVTAVDFDGDERRGLVAACRRGGERHSVALLEVTAAGPLPLETRLLLDAYRRWCSAAPLTVVAAQHGARWAYARFGASPTGDPTPLALLPSGDWDPSDGYWGEPGEPLHPLCDAVIAAGVRPCFEMEQVLPGVDDDWDSDPIVGAADLHRAGLDREAVRLLEGLLAIDDRCVDAWGHLGLVAFDTRGPGPARQFYETGVAIAERSLPDGFDGVLPWGLVDNRPFLRCLHGLGLCAWRQRRWDEAEAVFTARVWLDPCGPIDGLACLDQVTARRRWSRW